MAAAREELQRWVERSSLTHDPLRHGHESAANAVPGLTLPLFAAMIEAIPAWNFERLVQADWLELFVAERPECAAYFSRLRERPSYREAIVAHDHPSVARSSEGLRRAKAAHPALRAALEGA